MARRVYYVPLMQNGKRYASKQIIGLLSCALCLSKMMQRIQMKHHLQLTLSQSNDPSDPTPSSITHVPHPVSLRSWHHYLKQIRLFNRIPTLFRMQLAPCPPCPLQVSQIPSHRFLDMENTPTAQWLTLYPSLVKYIGELSILYFNARSLLPKIDELRALSTAIISNHMSYALLQELTKIEICR